MQYRTLGKTDLSVSAIAMGCWVLAGDTTWGPQNEADSIATVHAALDAGVTLFDTAEGYGAGASESILGRALTGRRSRAVIATKLSRSNSTAEQVSRACHASLQRLQTNYIDLYQIHWPSRSVPLDETMGALDRLRQQGKIRAVGVCNLGVQDLSDLLPVGRPASNQLPYSLLWRAIEYEIQGLCVAENVDILCYSPLAQGLLTGKFHSADEVPEGRARTRHFGAHRPQARHGEPGCEAETFAAIERIRTLAGALGRPMSQVALAWLLCQPGVAAVITGARRPDQIVETAQAVDRALSPDSLAALDAATVDLKHRLGPNPDMWQSDGRFR